jgi:uncharacterized protein (TIGR03083 family)
MEISEWIAALQIDGERLAAAAEAAGPDAPVPSCPDWVVRDLVRHQGGVHRWATGYVAEARTELWDVDLDEVVGTWPDDAELVPWFRAGHAGLVEALSKADPDLQCWTFLKAPSPLAMWARRQAHETSIHRVDAELAAGVVPSVPYPAFAADGVDELLTCFVARRGGRLKSDPPKALAVRATDTAAAWTVQMGPEGVEVTTGLDGAAGDGVDPRADCELLGPAADLYLSLWNRSESPSGLAVAGDDAVLALFREKVQIRWS